MGIFIRNYFWIIFFFPFLLFIVPLVNELHNKLLKGVLGSAFMLAGIIYLSFVVSLAPILLAAVMIFIFSLIFLSIKGYFRNAVNLLL